MSPQTYTYSAVSFVNLPMKYHYSHLVRFLHLCCSLFSACLLQCIQFTIHMSFDIKQETDGKWKKLDVPGWMSSKSNSVLFSMSPALSGVLLSMFGKLLIIPAIIWSQTDSDIYLWLTRVFVFTSNVQAIKGGS